MGKVDEKKKYLAEKSLEVTTDIRKSRIRESKIREKTYMLVVGGSLTLSVSFLTASGIEGVTSDGLLIFSWMSLLAAIILKLTAYVTVDWHFSVAENRVRKWREDALRRGDFDLKAVPKEQNFWTFVTRGLNYMSYTAAIIGLVALVFFGSNNIQHMIEKEDERKTGDVPSEQREEKFAEPTVSAPPLSDSVDNMDLEKPTSPAPEKKSE